jgi:hypothetical protein
MIKLVWDTSAIINIKESNAKGYSPGRSLYKDFSDGWIKGPYQNIFPSLAVFEVAATVSRMRREDICILREFYIMDENSVLYDVDQKLISESHNLFAKPGFDQLRGADLVFACIAYIEEAYLVTKDRDFGKNVSEYVRIIDLNDSLHSPKYRRLLD